MPRIISPAPSIPEVLETPENACGGVLVALLPGLGPQTPPVRRGHFFDNSIDRGAVLEAFIGWFSLWGIPVCRMRGGEGPFERQFSTLQWPSEACVLAHAHGVQMVPRIASRIDELAVVLEQRRPRLVIFLSRYLWLAANLPESRERLAAAAGAPLDEGRRISAHRLNATHQRWQRLEMLALAQPSKNTRSCTSPPFSMLTTRFPCSSKCRAVGAFSSFSGCFTIHFKSCNVTITATFLPAGYGRPDGSAQESR